MWPPDRREPHEEAGRGAAWQQEEPRGADTAERRDKHEKCRVRGSAAAG